MVSFKYQQISELMPYIAYMEKIKLNKTEVFNGKVFNIQATVNKSTGKSDVWIVEDCEDAYRFSITKSDVGRRELLTVIADLEDNAHSYAHKEDVQLLMEALSECGFRVIEEEGQGCDILLDDLDG